MKSNVPNFWKDLVGIVTRKLFLEEDDIRWQSQKVSNYNLSCVSYQNDKTQRQWLPFAIC